MLINFKLFIGIFFLTGLAHSRPFAGPISSGGGVGVLCKKQNREVLTLLDIWEAENVYSFGKPKILSSINDYLYKWNQEWTEAQGINFDSNLFDIQKLITNAFEPVEQLKLLNDFTRWKPIPSNCQYTQIVKFIDPPFDTLPEDLWSKVKIQVVISKYNQLDELNKAALLQHEFNYFASRFLSGYYLIKSGSDITRIQTAAQTTENSNRFAPKFPNKLICNFLNYKGNKFVHHFYAQSDSQNGIQGIRFYFQWINNYVMPIRATTFVPGLNESELITGTFKSPIHLKISYNTELAGISLDTSEILIQASSNPEYPLMITNLKTKDSTSTTGSCN